MSAIFAPPAGWPLAVGLPIALGILAFLLRWVRRSALLAGIPLGVVVLRLGGLGGFLVLTAFFLLGTGLTRLGYARKEAAGVAEEAGGRRGASHALANCGAGLLILVLRAVLHPGAEGSALLWAAYVGAFASAASDTASSEIGQLIGKHPISPRTMRPVAVGTEGAVSAEGTLAGVAAAGVLAGVGAIFGLLSPLGVIAVTIGGFLGNFLESLAGTWGRKLLPHGLLNFANTVVGAIASALLCRVIAAP